MIGEWLQSQPLNFLSVRKTGDPYHRGEWSLNAGF